MLVTDYIVSFLISKNITDVFGYPGGMVTYLMDSLDKRKESIKAHLCYHEQGAAFAACGYAQVTGLPGVAYATSGPGATNLLTGIANAYFDSIPCIFITGQVNTYDIKTIDGMRQNGFQETDIVSIAQSVTKYATQITNPSKIREELEKAFYISMEGRKGPVLLDIPMNIQRAEIDLSLSPANEFLEKKEPDYKALVSTVMKALSMAKRPMLIVGAGVRNSGAVEEFRQLVELLKIPVVSSMIAIDVLPTGSKYSYGFLGAYGHRWANFSTAKTDLILVIGSRLDGRQTGSDIKNFAENAQIIRVDIDKYELEKNIKPTDTILFCDIKNFLCSMLKVANTISYDRSVWLESCQKIKQALCHMDKEEENQKVNIISKKIPSDAIVTTDVGQNQVWVAQSFFVKNQQILFSGGLGSMGYSLPAAIGASYGSRQQKQVYCFSGDGGLQMNIQELQVIARDQLPIKIIVLNNNSLGMIRHFQEMYFNKNYTQTVDMNGYSAPDFCKIASAYGIKSRKIKSVEDFKADLESDEPFLFDVECNDSTYVFPKLAVNKPIYDQEPLMDRALLKKLKGNI